MSVIYKTEEEMKVIAGGLLYHIELFRSTLNDSGTFKKIKTSFEKHGLCDNFDEFFILWLMNRMWVANKVAYTVQYGDGVALKEDLPEIIPVNVELSYLSLELRSLNYNIYTNAGQYWLDKDWHDIFLLISKTIKDKSKNLCFGGVR